MKKLKAEKVNAVDDMLKPGKGIVWTVYYGPELVTAETIHTAFNAFLMSGELMPVHGRTEKLNIQSLEKTFYDAENIYEVKVEAIVVGDKPKKGKTPNE